MEETLKEVKQHLQVASEVEKKVLVKKLHDLLQSFESSDDTVNRIGYLPLQLSAARIGIDLRLFNFLADSATPKSLEELENVTAMDPILLIRLLRYMSSVGLISEPEPHHFSANQVTTNLATPGNQGAICHCFDTCGPMFQELPGFLRKPHDNLKDPYKGTVFQSTYKTKLSPYVWFAENPERLEWFNQYMASRRDMEESWLSLWDIPSEVGDWSINDPLYVNVGGGIGHQCREFREKFPNLLGRVILQDLPKPIENALQTPGVENMTHDFFNPQPIIGAKYYFLRGVLHNWPDNEAKLILRNIIPAMKEHSFILIDEPILPESHVHAYVAAMDLTMMCALGGIQRTYTQWVDLLTSIDLGIVEHVYYKEDMYEGVLKVVPVQYMRG